MGGDDNVEEFLQIKSVVPNGPAWEDSRLKTGEICDEVGDDDTLNDLVSGDVLVYVNDTCVLGFTHHDMVTMFQSITTGEMVNLEVCRGYPLPFDPDDPNTEIVTTVAVTSPDQNDWASELERQRGHPAQPDGHSMSELPNGSVSQLRGQFEKRPGSADLLSNDDQFAENEVRNALMGLGSQDVMTIPITKGGMGFGFTIADSGFGQKVKKILDRQRCKNLQEGDILIEIDNINVRNMSHSEVVQVLKDCARGQESNITIQRGLIPMSPSKNKYKKEKGEAGLRPKSGFLFRSKTPTADMYSAQEKEKVPNRPKTPLVDTRNMGRSKTPTALGRQGVSDSHLGPAPFQRNDITRASLGIGGYSQNYGGGSMGNPSYGLPDHMSGLNLHGDYSRGKSPGRELDNSQNHNYYNQQYPQDYPGGYQPDPAYSNGMSDYNSSKQYQANQGPMGGYNGYPGGYDPSATYGYHPGNVQGYSPAEVGPGGVPYRAGSLPRGRKESTSFEHSEPLPGNLTRWPRPERRPTDCVELSVTLHRQESGFGFRIVGGTEEGSQVSIGHIVPGGAADIDGRLFSGDEIVAVNDNPVLNSSHHQVVSLMGQAANSGRVTLVIRRKIYQPGEECDVWSVLELLTNSLSFYVPY